MTKMDLRSHVGTPGSLDFFIISSTLDTWCHNRNRKPLSSSGHGTSLPQIILCL
jgi:hypothetical protein